MPTIAPAKASVKTRIEAAAGAEAATKRKVCLASA